MAESTLTRHDLEARIVKRCWENEAFHREFTADPAATAVKYLQLPAASLPKIVVHEEPSGSWHIVLPPKPANAGELSEQDLERVAGGVTLTPPWLVATVITVGVALDVAITVGVPVSAAVTVLDKGW